MSRFCPFRVHTDRYVDLLVEYVRLEHKSELDEDWVIFHTIVSEIEKKCPQHPKTPIERQAKLPLKEMLSLMRKLLRYDFSEASPLTTPTYEEIRDAERHRYEALFWRGRAKDLTEYYGVDISKYYGVDISKIGPPQVYSRVIDHWQYSSAAVSLVVNRIVDAMHVLSERVGVDGHQDLQQDRLVRLVQRFS